MKMSNISDSSQKAANKSATPVYSSDVIKNDISDRPEFKTGSDISVFVKPSPSLTEKLLKRRGLIASKKNKLNKLFRSSLGQRIRPRLQNVTALPSFVSQPPNASSVATSNTTITKIQSDQVVMPSSAGNKRFSSSRKTPFPSAAASSPNAKSSPSSVYKMESVDTVISVENKKSSPTQKKVKKKINKSPTKWKTTDDLKLILSVQHTNNLEDVCAGVTFSAQFSDFEIQRRWNSLLYNPVISQRSMYKIKQLSSEVVTKIKAKLMFNEAEDKLISSVPSDKGNLEVFQELLNSNASVFLESRTAKSLLMHWTLMKKYNFLEDQSGQNTAIMPDVEEMYEDSDLQGPKDDHIIEEIANINKKHLQEIKHYENEVEKWRLLVEYVTGEEEELDSKTLAVLRGQIVRYLIQFREVSFGRSAKDNAIDIDLALEGPAWKISRQQGTIKLDNDEFYLFNEAKLPVFVDGTPVLKGSKYRLNNDSVIYIDRLRFIFSINRDAITALKAKLLNQEELSNSRMQMNSR